MGTARLSGNVPLAALAGIGAVAAFASLAWMAPGPAVLAPSPGAVAGWLQRPRHPMPEAPVRALPSSAESDASVRSALERAGAAHAAPLVERDRLVERFVASVHAASRGVLPSSALPLVRPAAAAGAPEPTLSQRDFARYEPYVRAAESLDTRALAALYRRLYPLLEEAYRKQAGAGAHFNDALVAAIDDALAAPRPGVPVRLVPRGGVMAFEDPGLEALSGARKLMVRIGPRNAERLSTVLREIRARIALQGPG